MKAVVQRVRSAKVEIDGAEKGAIGQGLMVLLGVAATDGEAETLFMAKKVANLRIFEDEGGKLNKSLLDIGGEALVVSNFTLIANAKKGNRPSFIEAARPELAIPLYEYFVQGLLDEGVPRVETGTFGADMQVEIHNDGPVTIVLDTEEIMPKAK